MEKRFRKTALTKGFDQTVSHFYGDKLNNYCLGISPEKDFRALYQIDRYKLDFLHYHHPGFH